MATIKTKAQLYADAVALPNPITRTALVAHLDNIVASYENIIQEYTTVQRNALTPFEGQKIYNTTSNRLEYYSASMWLPCSQKETVAVDCSANPNYQEGLVGDQYIVTVAGIIGGGSGKAVAIGDFVYCINDNAGGTEASVGSNWMVSNNLNNEALSDTPRWIRVQNASYAAYSAASTTNAVTIWQLEAGCVIHDCKVIPISAFSGGAIASYTISVGISGSAAKYCAAKNVFTGYVINGVQSPIQGIESLSGQTAIIATATSSGANLDQATAGEVSVFLLLSKMPTL